MIYPSNFEIKTGFDRIRQQIETFCLSEMGRSLISEMQFSSDVQKIIFRIESTDEFCRILISGKPFPSQDYFDLRGELKRLKIPGTYIEVEKLAELCASLRTKAEIVIYFNKTAHEEYLLLKGISAPLYYNKKIFDRIDEIVDNKGNIRDDASPELKELRVQQVRKKVMVEKRVKQIYLALKKDGIAADEAEITVRNGRSVIPLPAANKRKIRGFIHDESASGQTVYIEPEEIFELNNQIREMESAEKREIIKILTQFTDELRPDIEAMLISYSALGELDFIRAKALFAEKIKAVLPKINISPGINFKKAINPILFLSSLKTGKEVVPLDIEINPQKRILIISGPNAGGKSVCLKTAGLLQYMLQCGLLIPVRHDSEAGIFESVFIEIGDEQSIENDLSTYSSHLRNIKELSETASAGMLFLIDEFGSGTEPQPGGAIAEAVLEHLSRSGAMGIVTTHYLNLKLMAGKIEGIINGAMLFDVKKLKPLYQMVTGQPGSSFAFEIAEKTGFSKEILANASAKTGTATLDFEHRLADLENEKQELEKQKTEFNIADDLLAGLIKRYTEMNEKLLASRNQIIQEAKTDAANLLGKTNSMIENTIRKIKENQADKDKTKEAREDLQEFVKEVQQPQKPEEIIINKKVSVVKKMVASKTIKRTIHDQVIPLKVGGFAMIKGQFTAVEIIEIIGNYAVVARGNIRLKIPIEQIEGSDRKPENKNRGKYHSNSPAGQLNDKLASFRTTIDVRGTRAEEVFPIIQKYIDEAVFLNVSEVSILHGKGNGILRSVIREYLSTVEEVKSFKDEVLERGGYGITVVSFRSLPDENT